MATRTSVPTSTTSITRDSTDSVQLREKCHCPQQRVVENFLIIWLDPNIKNHTTDFQDSIDRLRSIVNSIRTFDDLDECIDFIGRPRSEKLFIITSNTLGPLLLRRIHRIPQLQSVFVFDANESINGQLWTREWNKVKGVFTQIEPLCDMIKSERGQCENNLTSISIVPPMHAINAVSNELDPSFMYTQILKEILLEMKHSDKGKREFIKFCRELYAGNNTELLVVDEFERFYPRQPSIDDSNEDPSPIWWYTRDCFIYSMLNKALRTQEIDIIIKMGFFIHDMHQQIEQLHSASEKQEAFIVYRGQGMLKDEFEKMKKNKGGLLSFNNFLSTSIDRNVALYFATKNENNADVTSILFRMLIDSSSLFASLAENISFFQNSEKEILFSMHTVFRIGDMKDVGKNLWEVELVWTRDDDEQLKALSDYMRKEIGEGTGWDRLGLLLVKMGELDKAEEIYTTLLGLTRDGDWRMLAHLNNQLGYIIKQKGDLPSAITFYQKALEIQLKSLLPTDLLDLATTYSNIGSVHDSMGDYTMALIFYQKALGIKQKSLPPDNISLATTYNNIALAYDSMNDYPTALFYYQKALRIQQDSLPSNHPSLATTYNNLGKVYRLMGDYPAALSFYQQAFDIFQKSLPSNHPSLALLYNNIGLVHDSMEDYPTALQFYEKSLEIKQKSLPANHSSFAITYNNIAFTHKSMAHYSIALSFFEKALDIARRSLPSDHQDIQDLFIQIGSLRKKF